MNDPTHLTAGSGLERKQTVLLIEDEDSVRFITEKVLRRFGFNVVCARDGEEGLNIYRSNSGVIDVVLLDLSMPKLTGEEVFSHILELNPDENVIITSGHTPRDLRDDLTKRARGFILKPFRILDLIDSIESIFMQVKQTPDSIRISHPR